MKKLTLAIFTFVTLCLSACEDSPEEKEYRVKNQQAKLEYEKQTEYMKATRKAIFEEEVLYQDNCKIGRMSWIDKDGWRDSVKAVICEARPTTSLQYRVGKSYRQVLEVGEAINDEEAKKKASEEAAKKALENTKKQALEKLTENERKALGL